MIKRAIPYAVVLAGTAVLLLGTPTSAGAQAEPTGRDFGHHVAECAQTSGMDGSHNPGMHHGFSNWDGLPC